MTGSITLPPRTIDAADLAAWAAEQPRDKRYDFFNHQNCAMAQYLRARGVEFRAVLGWSVGLDDGTEIGWEQELTTALQAGTFGALHDDLIQLLAESRA